MHMCLGVCLCVCVHASECESVCLGVVCDYVVVPGVC